MSGLNYPVGGAFHLEPGLPLFITDGARLHCVDREIHSVQEKEKVNVRQRSVDELLSNILNETLLCKEIQAPWACTSLLIMIFHG